MIYAGITGVPQKALRQPFWVVVFDENGCSFRGAFDYEHEAIRKSREIDKAKVVKNLDKKRFE